MALVIRKSSSINMDTRSVKSSTATVNRLVSSRCCQLSPPRTRVFCLFLRLLPRYYLRILFFFLSFPFYFYSFCSLPFYRSSMFLIIFFTQRYYPYLVLLTLFFFLSVLRALFLHCFFERISIFLICFLSEP